MIEIKLYQAKKGNEKLRTLIGVHALPYVQLFFRIS